ncbi:MAG: hypothetical protein IKP48_04670 [Bacteroidaceae bacterium]|nr:hypothetical protein [Bacteroidaceae bacterium]
MKQWMILAFVMTIGSSMVLTSCSDDDYVLVSDNKSWTISADDMDPNVRPGDDFFMYSNGNYWKSTSVQEDSVMIVSFFRSVVASDINKMLADLALPSMEVLKAHKALPKPKREEMEAFVTQRLQPLKEASTLEEAWRTTGELIAEGLTFNFSLVMLNYHTVLTAIMFPKEMNLPMPDVNVLNERINSPDYQDLLMPLAGSYMTRGAESQQWPMLVAWCEGLGANPEHVLTWKTYNMETISEAQVKPHIQKWDDELMALQAMDLESYKQAACDIFLESTVKDMESIADESAQNIYNDYCTYEKNRAFADRYLTPAMIERTKEICLELKQTFANRLSRCTWLDVASRASAIEKLDAMEFYIGKPDYWVEEAMPNLSASHSLIEDQLLLSQSRRYFEAWLIGKPCKGNTFNYLIYNNTMNLYEINSGYMPAFNAMMIMPTMIMPPMMPTDVNEAIIYATAVVIGHEMTHGFDSSGALYDKNGEKNDIFVGQADLDEFKQISQQLADCYSSLEVMPDQLPGVFNDGNYTLGENIADLGGLEMAYEAYTNRLKRQGFEGEQLRLQQQRFYLAFAHMWQAKYSALYARERTLGRNEYGAGKDEHSLERERVNGVVMNTDAWYDLFDVKPGDKLYRKPEERVHIW